MYGALLLAWIGLLALLTGSVATTVLVQGPAAIAMNIGCAGLMAAIVFIVFMRLGHADGLMRLIAVGGMLWVALLLALSLADFLTR